MSEQKLLNMLVDVIVPEDSGNWNQSIKTLQQQVSDINVRPVVLETLDEVTDDLGIVRSGEFRVGNGVEPGEGFSGMRIIYPEVEYPEGSGDWYNLVGVYEDAVQVGINSNTGAFMAAGGAVVIDQQAMTVTGLLYPIKHDATYGATVRHSWTGMYLPEGTTTPAYGIFFSDDPGAEVISNGGFETGDTSDWTVVNANVVNSGPYSFTPKSGSWFLEYNDGAGAGAHAYTDRYAVTAGVSYYLSCYVMNFYVSSQTLTGQILWYDAPVAGTLLRTDTFLSTGAELFGWFLREGIYVAPTGATHMTIHFTWSASGGSDFGYGALDGVSLTPVTTATSITFEPNVTIRGGPLALKELPAVPADPPANTGQLYEKNGELLFNKAVNNHIKILPNRRVFWEYSPLGNNQMIAWGIDMTDLGVVSDGGFNRGKRIRYVCSTTNSHAGCVGTDSQTTTAQENPYVEATFESVTATDQEQIVFGFFDASPYLPGWVVGDSICIEGGFGAYLVWHWTACFGAGATPLVDLGTWDGSKVTLSIRVDYATHKVYFGVNRVETCVDYGGVPPVTYLRFFLIESSFNNAGKDMDVYRVYGEQDFE